MENDGKPSLETTEWILHCRVVGLPKGDITIKFHDQTQWQMVKHQHITNNQQRGMIVLVNKHQTRNAGGK